MKNVKIICGLLVATVLSLVSCSKDEETPKEIVVDKDNVALAIDGTASVFIQDGNGNYTVSNSKPEVATSTLSGSTVSIVAKSAGTSEVIITDAKSKTKKITVTVWSSIALDKKAVEINLDEATTAEVNITTGEGTYTVTSDNQTVATAVVAANKVTITGVGVGTAKITVTDSKTSKAEVIEVSVKKNLKLDVSSVVVKANASTTVNVSGSGKYDLKVAKPTVTEVTETNGVLTIKGNAVGETEIIVTDTVTTQSQTLVVSVLPASYDTTAALNFSTRKVTVQQGLSNYKELWGGTPKTITYGTEGIVNVRFGVNIYEEAVLMVEGLKVGTTTVTVSDGVISKTFNVEVTAVLPFKIADLSQVVDDNQQGSVLIEGSGKYQFTIKDPTMVEIKTPDFFAGDDSYYLEILKKAGAKTGTTTVTVKDIVQNKEATITVTVE